MASAKKLESGYKKDIVDAVNKAGGYATRVEDQYRVGILDLILAFPETGIVLAEAKRFTGNFFEPSPRQFIEMCNIDKGGGVALLIGIKNETYFLSKTNLLDPQRGRVYTEDCTIQMDWEAFPAVFKRWFKERNL